jgi:nucleoside-diphosphate-sugar epimerase
MDGSPDRSDLIVITGSGGFIGRALAARLRFTVVGLDVVEEKGDTPHTDQDVADALARVRADFGARIASVIPQWRLGRGRVAGRA